MSDSPSFEDLLKEEGSAPIQKISKVKADVGKARVDREALARARRLAEKGQDLDFSGLAPMNRPCWIRTPCCLGPGMALIR